MFLKDINLKLCLQQVFFKYMLQRYEPLLTIWSSLFQIYENSDNNFAKLLLVFDNSFKNKVYNSNIKIFQKAV